MPLPQGDRAYTVSRIWEHYHEVLRLALIGAKGVEIATIVGLTPVMVSTILNSPVVKMRLAEMQAARDMEAVDVGRKIQNLQAKAIDYLEDVLEDGTAMTGTRVKVAQDLLDRGGHGAVRKQEIVSTHLTSEDIRDIQERARVMKDMEGQVIDVG